VSRPNQLVYRRLREMILSGALAPGAPLREEELAELCGVSRTPVREAIRRLETEMFVRRTESQRSYVAEWTAADIEEVFTLRGMMEGHAARRAATRAAEQGLDALQAVNDDIRAAVSRAEPDVDAFLRGNGVFHGLILEMAASERLAGLLNRLILQPIVQRTALRYDRAQLERSVSEHDEIVAALRRRDPDWATAVMTAHIRRAYHVYADQLGEDLPARSDYPVEPFG
jgi:DNA-binding GntR family transcriptional regulator